MPSLNVPQAEFLALPKKYRLFVAGYGGGKTRAGAAQICRDAWELPRIPMGYFAPTYPMMRDIWYPTIEEAAFDWGLRTRVHESNKEVHLFNGKTYRATVICRSMEKPQDIVGFKIGHAHVDEIDLLPLPKAQTAWRKIIARLRHPERKGLVPRNGADVTTTPEGFTFAYNTFVKDVRDKPSRGELYGMVRASTHDNEANLPDGYIESLYESYPPNLIQAYIDGHFTNLTAGTVYPNFDRAKNSCPTRIEGPEPIHIGMDFNVGKMAAVIGVIRGNWPHITNEAVKIADTREMARVLKSRYGTTPDGARRVMVVYPDASGQNTSSKNASESDLTILQQEGFVVQAATHNPAVKDRVNAVNALLLNAQGHRRLLVNTAQCPVLTESLEQQAYAPSGEPDKTTGHDHTNDGLGYFIVARWPILRPTSGSIPLRA